MVAVKFDDLSLAFELAGWVTKEPQHPRMRWWRAGRGPFADRVRPRAGSYGGYVAMPAPFFAVFLVTTVLALRWRDGTA